ncbi:hypothetical protein ASPZODRAFT_64406 [Penicilliopsis zonata CBS 506.65]|uniref:N-acetyltransferase domain-containing protein n=1 Tax=Penicilliopsis zonata CBS 506.65 TaxID=1073090 RepID=A0A1L9SLJ3_9EURO|nr:hypothetical protein ASPZODRAFT_64406 [Penicilliopsis zonata CBS 506.65]OJJ48003.1 hypothetical protein ASPZODRAFT_64406 [Penicilliopsis zonata CBS 506.65]
MPSILENVDGLIPPPETAVKMAPLLHPRSATLKTGELVTVHPVVDGPSSLASGLIDFLHAEFSAEIARGCTYPMEEPMERDKFAEYWFGTFAVVVLRGDTQLTATKEDWSQDCLGTFYIKPNYPGRCSHVCNAGFLTTSLARGQGIGIAMGETYLEYAPKLGYKYSVFNLVFANNPASIRIWEKLGFSIIGRVPKAARLANSEEPVDALIYGRELA